MMGSPEDVPLIEIKQRIEELKHVQNIHHVHCWCLNEQSVHFEAHVEIDDMRISESKKVYKEIDSILKNEFRIGHVTLQFEHNSNHSQKLVE